MAALFEDDATYTFIDGRIFSGQKEIEAFYRGAFSRMESGLTHQATVEEEMGPAARGSFCIRHADGNSPVLSGRYEIEFSAHGRIRRLVLTT